MKHLKTNNTLSNRNDNESTEISEQNPEVLKEVLKFIQNTMQTLTVFEKRFSEQ